MKDSFEDSKPVADIDEILRQVKNDLHQKQQLFIAQKAYTDALENLPAADDTSPEAEEARRHLDQAKITLENLAQMVEGTPLTPPS